MRCRLFIFIFLVSMCGCADLVFVSEKNGHPQIYEMSVSGKPQVNISQNRYEDQFPDLSPDGKKIVFSSSRFGPGTNIYVMNMEGDNVKQITSGDLVKTNPRWSPRYDLIAFAEYTPVNKAKIFCVNSDGTGTPWQATYPGNLQSDSGGFDFFDHGDKIIFARYDGRKGTYDLHYRSLTDDGETHAITKTDEISETLPVVSHDGRLVAFVVFQEMDVKIIGKIALDHIQILEVGTWTPVNTINMQDPVVAGSVSAIAFSQDAEHLYIAARASDVIGTPKSQYEIFSIGTDGSGQKRLTRNMVSDAWPSAGSRRWLTMKASPLLTNKGDKIIGRPGSMKQGDTIIVKIEAGDAGDLQEVRYKVNEKKGVRTSLSSGIQYDTCKDLGNYMRSLSLWGEATYRDGERQRFYTTYDLTASPPSREDSQKTYAFYVSEDGEAVQWRNIDRATAFVNHFDSYGESQYYFADPRFYTHAASDYADSADMTLSIGHGRHHSFFVGNSEVDISSTKFGSLSECNHTGDLEYLAFISGKTLSLENNGGHPFRYYWFHENDTKLTAKPFTGLHMVLGFRSDIAFRHSTMGDDGADFLRGFARNLDDGMTVREAWLEAADSELSFNEGNNRAVVVYLETYANDRLEHDEKHDYIYGNAHYNRAWVEYY